MKHLFVTNDFPPKLGGIESYLVNLCSGFEPDDIVVVAPAREGYQAVDRTLPYKVVRVPGTYLRATDAVTSHIVSAAHEHEPDAVHFLHALPLGRLAPAVRDRTGAIVTIVAHGSGDILIPARAPLVRRTLRKTLVDADLVFSNSDFMRGRVEALTRERVRVEVLRPCIDLDRFSLTVSGAPVRETLRLGSRFVVLFTGRLVKRKGADVLIRAMAGVRRSVAVIAGTGPEEQALRRLVEELDMSRRVLFAGSVPDALLPMYYAAADVFCMPAADRLGGLDTEGFGVVYLEAAATGLPSVAGRCGGSAEAVLDGETGVVIEGPTPRNVADALRTFEADTTLRALLGAAARDRVEREHSPAVMAETLENAVSQLSGERVRTRA